MYTVVIRAIKSMCGVDEVRVVTGGIERFARADKVDLLLRGMSMVRKHNLVWHRDDAGNGNTVLR
jgi:hypothetical protein